jgi:tRNA threonylcarbamoyladenosine biosynthesis protein TsaB
MPAMRTLAIETSGPRGGIALLQDGNLLDEAALAEGLRHGRDLIAVTKAACDHAGWDPRGINLVAVSIGPGSFTGLRIAVTVAKFMAWDTGARIVGVPTLRVMAANAPPDARRIVPILDAKRGGLYASVFERRGAAPGEEAWPDGLVETFGPALIEPDDLAARLARPALVLGRGIEKARPALAGLDLAPEALWDPRAGVVGRLGLEMDARGRHADPWRLEPVYIRRPEAEEIWERRHG